MTTLTDLFGLKGHCALVTGASSGFGIEFADMGRLGRPEEVRAALLFLVSPAASYVTGSTVFVDGGYTAW